MELLERKPLPIRCQKCKELDCLECDYAGERFYYCDKDMKRLEIKAAYKQMERTAERILRLEKELAEMENAENEIDNN